jgi:hypothetical protein
VGRDSSFLLRVSVCARRLIGGRFAANPRPGFFFLLRRLIQLLRISVIRVGMGSGSVLRWISLILAMASPTAWRLVAFAENGGDDFVRSDLLWVIRSAERPEN